MVLNFNKLKERPFKVERSCIKKIGDPNFILTKIVRIRYNGNKNNIPNKDKVRSINLFIYLYIITK